MFDQIIQSLTSQDYHHFDKYCKLGLRHSIWLYFLILFAYLIQIHQSITIYSGLQYFRKRRLWPIMNNNNFCSFTISFICTLPLLLDIHILRFAWFIALLFYLIIKIAQFRTKSIPQIKILVLDILFLLLVEIIHITCYPTLFKILRIVSEMIRNWIWNLIIEYRHERQIKFLLYLNILIQMIFIYNYLF